MAPKLGATEGAAEGTGLAPKAKPVELAPNDGLTGVPKVADVVAFAVDPKVKGAEEGAGLEADVDDALPTPNVNGFGGVAEEPKVDCVAGTSNADFAKAKVGWVVVAADAVEAVLGMANPPNDAVIVFGLGAGWPCAVFPKENTFWFAA